MFIGDSTSIESDLELCPNGRNEALIVVGMDGSSNQPSFQFGEDIEERMEQVEDYLVAFQEERRGPPSTGCSSTPPPHNNGNVGMHPS